MRNPVLALAGLALLAACAEVQGYGVTAVERRRMMNDLQARAAMDATCDIPLGAYFRELSEAERRYADLLCGGGSGAADPAVPQDAAPEAPF